QEALRYLSQIASGPRLIITSILLRLWASESRSYRCPENVPPESTAKQTHCGPKAGIGPNLRKPCHSFDRSQPRFKGIDESLPWMIRYADKIEAVPRQLEVEDLHESARCQFGLDEHVAQQAHALPCDHRLVGRQLLAERHLFRFAERKRLVLPRPRRGKPSSPCRWVAKGRRPVDVDERVPSEICRAQHASAAFQQPRVANRPVRVFEQLLGNGARGSRRGVTNSEVRFAGAQVKDRICPVDVDRNIAAALAPALEARQKPATRKGV